MFRVARSAGDTKREPHTNSGLTPIPCRVASLSPHYSGAAGVNCQGRERGDRAVFDRYVVDDPQDGNDPFVAEFEQRIAAVAVVEKLEAAILPAPAVDIVVTLAGAARCGD